MIKESKNKAGAREASEGKKAVHDEAQLESPNAVTFPVNWVLGGTQQGWGLRRDDQNLYSRLIGQDAS